MATPSLTSIFEAITPENIKNIPVVKHTMDIFLENLEANSKISRKIISLYDTEKYSDDSEEITASKQRIRNGLYLLYTNTLYKCLQSMSSSKEINKILNKFNYINSPLRRYQELHGITAENQNIEENPSVSKNTSKKNSSTPEFSYIIDDYIQKSDSVIGKEAYDLSSSFASTVINNEYISSNREFNQKVGTSNGLKYIYAFAKYIETGEVENDLSIEEINPFLVHYEGSLNSTIFKDIMKVLAHPLGWAYDYTTVFTVALRDYFGIEFTYTFNRLEISDTSGNFYVFTDKSLEDVYESFETRINPKTQQVFTKEEILKQVSVVEGRHVYDYQYWEDSAGYGHQLISFDDKDEHIIYNDTSKQLIYYSTYEDYVNGLKNPEKVFDSSWKLDIDMKADVKFLYKDDIEHELDFHIGWVRDKDHSIGPSEFIENENKNKFKVCGEPYVFVQGIDESRNRCKNYSEVNSSIFNHIAKLELNQDYDGKIIVEDVEGNSVSVNCLKNINIIQNGEINYYNNKFVYSKGDFCVYQGLIYKSLTDNNDSVPELFREYTGEVFFDLNSYVYYDEKFYRSLVDHNADNEITDQTKFIRSNITKMNLRRPYGFYDRDFNYSPGIYFVYNDIIYLVTEKDAVNSVPFESIVPCSSFNKEFNLERIFFEHTGKNYAYDEYDNLETYFKDQIVVYNNTLYRCKVDYITINDNGVQNNIAIRNIPVTNTDVWEIVDNANIFEIDIKTRDYEKTRIYNTNDKVSYEQKNYRCLADNVKNITPDSDPNVWKVYGWELYNKSLVHNSTVEIDTHELKGSKYKLTYDGNDSSENFYYITEGLNSNNYDYYINVPIVYSHNNNDDYSTSDDNENLKQGYGILITGHNKDLKTVYIEVQDIYKNSAQATANCDNKGNFKVRIETTEMEPGYGKIIYYSKDINQKKIFKKEFEFSFLNKFDKSPNFCGILEYNDSVNIVNEPITESIYLINQMINFNSNSSIEHVTIGEQRDGSFAPEQTYLPYYMSSLEKNKEDQYLEDYTDNRIINIEDNPLKDKIIHGNIIDGIDYWKSFYTDLDEDVFVDYGFNHDYLISYYFDSKTEEFVPNINDQLSYIRSFIGYIDYLDENGNKVEYNEKDLKEGKQKFHRYYISERDQRVLEESEFNELRDLYYRSKPAYTSDFIVMTSDRYVQEDFEINAVGKNYYLYTEPKDNDYEQQYLYSSDGFYFYTEGYNRGTIYIKDKQSDFKQFNDANLLDLSDISDVEANWNYRIKEAEKKNDQRNTLQYNLLSNHHYLDVEGFEFINTVENNRHIITIKPDLELTKSEDEYISISAIYDKTISYYIDDILIVNVGSNADEIDVITSDGLEIYKSNLNNTQIKFLCTKSGNQSITFNALKDGKIKNSKTLDIIILKHYINITYSGPEYLRKNSEFTLTLDHNVEDYTVLFNNDLLELTHRRNTKLEFKCLRPTELTTITFEGLVREQKRCENVYSLHINEIYLNVDTTPIEVYEGDDFELPYSTDADSADVTITEFKLELEPDLEKVEVYEGDDIKFNYICNSDENINISVTEQKN